MEQADNPNREAIGTQPAGTPSGALSSPTGDARLVDTAEADFRTKFELRGPHFTLYGRVSGVDGDAASNQPTPQPPVEINIVPTDMARNMFNSGSPQELANLRDELQTALARADQLSGSEPMFWG